MATQSSSASSIGPLMLLESFVDQAIRHSINMLSLRVRLGKLQQQQQQQSSGTWVDGSDNGPDHMWSFADFERARIEMAELQPKMQNTFSLVDKLSARTVIGESLPNLRARSKFLDLLRMSFSDILPGSGPAGANPARRQHVPADALLSATSGTARAQYEIARASFDQHHLWTLVRPNRPPIVVVQQFLLMSAQIAQLEREGPDTADPLRVGGVWYTMLADLLALLALSAHEFGVYSCGQVLQAMDLVSPHTDDRKVLHPLLWNRREAQCISSFDDSWMVIRELIEAMDGPKSAAAVKSLHAIASPHKFCETLYRYLESSMEFMQPPLLDVYYNIRQTCQVPHGFFETPDQTANLPVHPQLVGESNATDDANNSEEAHLALLDPFSPQASASASRLISLSSAEHANGDNAQSPSDRLTQAHAYDAMAISVKRTTAEHDRNNSSPTEAVLSQRSNHNSMRDYRTPIRSQQQSSLLACDGEDSGMSDVEMSPSQHAAIKRQRSSDLTSVMDVNSTPPRRKCGLDTSALDDDSMDVENTVVVESPSALLSAKHDRRVRQGVQRTQAPPALHLTPERATNSTATTVSQQQLQPSSADGMTTPKSRRDASKYVSNWEQGDVEGGGRQHRRRHDLNALGTPNASRVNMMQPPPQTLLSPKNIAAAAAAAQRRNNTHLDT
ncbi:hypothetical protein GGF43_005359, partial [Coemansia sp. RSA 2618]